MEKADAYGMGLESIKRDISRMVREKKV